MQKRIFLSDFELKYTTFIVLKLAVYFTAIVHCVHVHIYYIHIRETRAPQ